jgi:hypothetical protein
VGKRVYIPPLLHSVSLSDSKRLGFFFSCTRPSDHTVSRHKYSATECEVVVICTHYFLDTRNLAMPSCAGTNCLDIPIRCPNP